jgi:flagellar basal body-associated protein FliL
MNTHTLTTLYSIVQQMGPMGPRGNGVNLTWIILLMFIFIVVAVGMFLYFDRRLKTEPIASIQPQVEQDIKDQENKEKALDVAIRLLNEDERRIVEALHNAGGSMLQKDITYDLDISRVKTHRIIAGLIKRDVVKSEKHYNTNKITLADWLN